MRAALVSMGFAPVRDANRAGALTYRLRNCPYRDAVRESQRGHLHAASGHHPGPAR